MSGLPKSCCATGSLHTGTPTGSEEKLHDRDVYVARPPAGTKPKGIVVIIPDIFGWTLPNNRILADEFAIKGSYLVYLPDFMHGWIFPSSMLASVDAMNETGLVANVMKAYHVACLIRYFAPIMYFNPLKKIKPEVETFFKEVRQHEDTKHLPVGAAGYCWGGYFTLQLAADTVRTDVGRPLIDAAYTAHPSFLTVPADIENVKLPLSIAQSEIDPQMPKAKAMTTKEILEKKNAEAKDGVKHEFVYYDGAHHGFAVRANEKDVEEAEMGKKAEKQAIDWYQRWFAQLR